MTQFQMLEQALGEVVGTFQRYCRKDGERNTLSRAELRSLLQTELPSLETGFLLILRVRSFIKPQADLLT